MQARQKQTINTLLAPGTLWIVVLYIIPLLLIILYSFLTAKVGGGVTWIFTAESYSKLFALDPDALFINNFVIIFLRTFWWGLLTVILCLFIGYPLAFYIAQQKPATRNLLIFLVVIPFWTNLLVRIYAWKFILNNNGFFNNILQTLGLNRIPMINTPGAVLLGLVYVSLPFMILPLYASMEKFNYAYVEAAQDLGAKYFQTFTRVFLPLTLPGLVTGSLLVFILTIGQFVVPVILGGGKVMMVGNLLALQFSTAFDWPFGAAIAMIFIVLMMGGLMAYIVSENRNRIA